MANEVKFGFSQIVKPTPDTAKKAFKVVLYTLGLVNLILAVFTDIPQPVKDVVGRYSIELAMFVHGFSKMFGIQVEDMPEVKQSGDTA